ncbi:MAG: exodeoxyribonuclease III [Anaerolineae bacterium]|nr:exodeoxyribonuclease III [Anaerolineae bacterium]
MSYFKIATYNANSIRMRITQLLAWLEREQPDVLCVQETKVQDKDFPDQTIEEAGFHVIFRGKKSYEGVAIISKLAPTAIHAGFEDDGPPDTTRLLSATYQGIAVINTYVPQGRAPESEHFQYKLAWFERLQNFLNQHYTPTQPLIWVGDFNVATEDIDVYDPKGLRGHVDFHPDAQAALETVRQWGFVDVYRQHHPNVPQHYSYWDYRARNPIERGIGWRIDHIWATKILSAKSTAAWIDVEARKADLPSDHTFVVAEFEI